jgi:hypothetical protein
VNKISLVATLLLASTFCVGMPQGQAQQTAADEMNIVMDMAMEHESHMTPPVTLAELEATASQLDKAKRATEKYQDLRVAEADGYRAFGPDVPGMGVHYVRVVEDRFRPGSRSSDFDFEHPAILLYEKEASSPSGYSLVGVSYLLGGDADADGQPRNPPFPKSLAYWHRHSNVCLFPDRSVKGNLTADQCDSEGGHFIALTQWMIHVWIWKDNPTGVFSPTNPNVQ